MLSAGEDWVLASSAGLSLPSPQQPGTCGGRMGRGALAPISPGRLLKGGDILKPCLVYLPWAEMCAFGGPGTVSLTQAVQ